MLNASGSGLTRYWPLLLLGVAATEVLAHAVARSRVPAESDYAHVAVRIGRELAADDAIVTAPAWAEPLLRSHLAEGHGLRAWGASDLAAFRRLWVVSIRGYEPAPELRVPAVRPAVDELYGAVRLRRYELGEPSVRYDFVDQLRGATVSIGEGPRARPCPWGAAPGIPGGLGGGPMPPRERFLCDGRGPWVGETVVETLDLEPRRCVYQHPARGEPIDVRFAGVPAGARLVVYTGLDYHDERDGVGDPYTLSIRLDGKQLGTIEHRDGDGWARNEIPLPAGHGSLSNVTFRVSSDARQRRSVCWAATIRGPARRHAE